MTPPSIGSGDLTEQRGGALARAHHPLERGVHEVVAREREAATCGAPVRLHTLETRERAVRTDVEARRSMRVPEHARELDAARESRPDAIALGEQLLLERLA